MQLDNRAPHRVVGVRTSARSLCAALSVAGLALLAGGCQSYNTSDGLEPDSISGRYIAVLCDADMGGSAFASGKLDRGNADASDAMTVVTLPISTAPGADASKWQTPIAQVGVSNSVMGPPTSLAINASGKLALVAETFQPGAAGATNLSDLVEGNSIIGVDMSDPMRPFIASKAEVGVGPQSIDFHPSGRFAAVATRAPGKQIVIVPVDGNKLGAATAWGLVGLDNADSEVVSSVSWHPSGKYLAVTVPERDTVAFYEFAEDVGDGTMGLAPWGNPVTVGKYPFTAKFTPDGRHVVTTDLQWGDDVKGFLVGAPAGNLSVIRVSAQSGDNPESLHQVVCTTPVGVSPESMAISSDGRYVVTANLRQSMMPLGSSELTGGSISLLTLDDSGMLTSHGEVELAAMPQGISFDRGNNHLIVSQFRSTDPEAVDGELAFFKLNKGASPSLTAGDFFVGVGIGPHGVVIVR